MTIILFAAKSVAIACGTLLVLRFIRGRSASDRSLIAHLGLAALAMLPLGSVLFPPIEVATSYASVLTQAVPTSSDAAWIAPIPAGSPIQASEPGWRQGDRLLLIYAVPALLLIARTLLSLFRLVLLTARARAITDDHWLQALYRGQRRIGLLNSTELLASPEIASPVSWGVLRPKILLNTDAVAARADADAIVAHELAHVARLDWLKLVLVRVSVALFWFNPFVWLLAREAHQLREEAADDAVLAADVEDTAYASLLVSAARLHRSGLLLEVHGVAPPRNSLAQRVRRVLDRDTNRSLGGARWAATMALGAAVLAAPLMTLQFTDKALASSVSGPLTSGEDAGVIAFELRRPPGEPNSMPESTLDSSDQAATDGEGPNDTEAADIEEEL